jgi:hypothetical protein
MLMSWYLAVCTKKAFPARKSAMAAITIDGDKLFWTQLTTIKISSKESNSGEFSIIREKIIKIPKTMKIQCPLKNI